MRRSVILLIIALLAHTTNAQVISPWRYDPSAKNVTLWELRRYEFNLGVGTTQIFGDIGGFSPSSNILGLKDVTINHTRININPSFKYRITKDIVARGSFAFGYFHAIDKRGSNINRGLESVTVFLEPALLGEYHFLISTIQKDKMRSKRIISDRSLFSKIDLYLFTGVGMITYNIIPNDLLEPRVVKKKGLAAVVPLGVGINLIYSRYFNLGLEFGGRYAFSDYVDGYTSQFSKFNDMYHLLNVNLTYKIKTGANGLPFSR